MHYVFLAVDAVLLMDVSCSAKGSSKQAVTTSIANNPIYDSIEGERKVAYHFVSNSAAD